MYILFILIRQLLDRRNVILFPFEFFSWIRNKNCVNRNVRASNFFESVNFTIFLLFFLNKFTFDSLNSFGMRYSNRIDIHHVFFESPIKTVVEIQNFIFPELLNFFLVLKVFINRRNTYCKNNTILIEKIFYYYFYISIKLRWIQKIETIEFFQKFRKQWGKRNTKNTRVECIYSKDKLSKSTLT